MTAVLRPRLEPTATARLTRDAAPLCVDLDGTLIRSDLMVEALICFLKENPLRIFAVLGWILRGPAHVKAELARQVQLDVASMPVDDEFISWLREQHGSGRRIVLCTAANERIANHVAAHFGLFDAVMASDGVTNLGGSVKAGRLVAEYGRGGFDYAANERKDLHVWRQARAAVIVAGKRLVAQLTPQLSSVERTFVVQTGTARDWIRALRLHQWAKNILLFVPLAAAHRISEPGTLTMVVLAFVLFGCCASGTYMINDMADLDSDRKHPHKRTRPLAAGHIPLIHGMAAAVALIGGSLLASALLMPPLFTLALLGYLGATLWYSLVLKRIAMVDVLSLAGLYTVRILAGGAAAAVVPSFWLLAFSMFLFLSLAAAKRYAELRLMLDAGLEVASGRGYSVSDLPLLHSYGIAAGYVCVLVLALYVNSGAAGMYSRPQLMWMLCPLLLYWISRVWLKTFRGQMHDDPVIFALTDRPSWAVAALGAIFVAAAL